MKHRAPPYLGDLELAVMNHLWSHGGQDAKLVHESVGRGRGITLNTIQSTLKRLFEKGLLRRDKVSHAHIYSPELTQAEFHRRSLQEVVDKFMGGRSDAMLSAFIGLTEQVGPEHLMHLERLVRDRLKAYRDPKEPS